MPIVQCPQGDRCGNRASAQALQNAVNESINMIETVGKKIAGSLVLQGVDTIFCVPGESYLGLTDALTDVPAIRLIVCRHEGGAGSMAIADGLLRGRAGVCLVSRGPGLTHAMVALHTAFHDAVPLIVLIGQVERRDLGRMALQEQNYSRLLCDITKSVIEVVDASQASDAISRAFHLAENGTPGPVAVGLPEDLLDEKTAAPLVEPRAPMLSGPREEDLAHLVELLKQAKRPLIYVGSALAGRAQTRMDSHSSGTAPQINVALEELERFAESWQVPVCSTNKRPHLFDCAHSHFAGHVGIRTPARLLDELKKTDLLIALGERLSDTLSQSYTFPSAPNPQMPLVHVWPDANEVGRVWRPALGLPCDPLVLLRALRRLPAPAAAQLPAGRSAWSAGLHALQAQLRAPVWDRVPQYKFWVEASGFGGGPRGLAAVRSHYEQLFEEGRSVCEYDIDRIVVDDDVIVTEGWFDQLFPGRVLRKRGVVVDDPDAVYNHRMRLLLLWPFDQEARLIGEDSYANGAMYLPENIRKLSANEVPPVYYDRLR